MLVVARKKPILGITIVNFNKTLSVHRNTLDGNAILVIFRSHLINAVPASQSISHNDTKRTVLNIFAIYSKSNKQFLFLVLYV